MTTEIHDLADHHLGPRSRFGERQAFFWRRVFGLIESNPRVQGLFVDSSESVRKKHEEFFVALVLGKKETIQAGM